MAGAGVVAGAVPALIGIAGCLWGGRALAIAGSCPNWRDPGRIVRLPRRGSMRLPVPDTAGWCRWPVVVTGGPGRFPWVLSVDALERLVILSW